MHAHLFTLGTTVVSTWSVLAVVATLAGLAVSMREARARGFAAGVLVELAVVVGLSGWLSAKLAHVVFEAPGHVLSDGRVAAGVVDLLRDDPWHWARLFDGGWVFYGGVVGAIVVGVVFARRAGLVPLGALFDAAVPGLLVGILVGRVGCFLGGCCFGSATSLPWAVHFPATHPTGGAGVHPVQLYDAVAAALGLVVWGTTLRRGAPVEGTSFCAFSAGYAVVRFATEFVRADPERGTIGPLSTSQAISVIVFVVAIIVLRALRRAMSRGSP